MDEQLFFTDTLSDFYGITPSRLNVLNTSALIEDGRNIYYMYRIQYHAGHTQLLFAYHDDFVIGPTFSWGSNQSLGGWLRHRAELLAYLAEQHYTAPRVIASQAGFLTTKHQHWNFLVTSYIDGDANVLSPENMVLLGSTLGRLHTIQLPKKDLIGPSWWNSTYSIPHALEQLTATASFIPSDYRDFYEKIQTTFYVIQQKLHMGPKVIIHGDCWAPNAISQGDNVVLIDWECAGQGAAILDLGTLLLRCQYNQHGEIPEEVYAERIISTVSGYLQYRSPSLEELDMLLEAIRFSILWGGAWIVTHRCKGGWNPKVEPLLTRIQRGYRLAEPIARLARAAFLQEIDGVI